MRKTWVSSLTQVKLPLALNRDLTDKLNNLSLMNLLFERGQGRLHGGFLAIKSAV